MCFIIAGFVRNAPICLAIGVVLTIVALLVLKKTIGSDTRGHAQAQAIDE